MSDKYFQQNKKLYTCFIDFRKAFDSIWRDALLYKLVKAGGGGIFENIIKDIYSSSEIQIKLGDGLTMPFEDNTGVKQGCVLSPTLFKLFINDLPDIFSENCDPVLLFKKKISCLMFADDIVLVSESSYGLQHALDKNKVIL
jgi:hypothetical protein